MQNSYTKEGQLSWWLAPLWFHKERSSNPLPFKIKNYFNFYPSSPSSPSPPSLRAYGSGTGLRYIKGPARPGPACWRPLLKSKWTRPNMGTEFNT